jgi:hypothetical protein
MRCVKYGGGQGQTLSEIDEVCGITNQKVCRNAVHMGFDGYAENAEDVKTGWHEQLEREGKDPTWRPSKMLDPSCGGVRETVASWYPVVIGVGIATLLVIEHPVWTHG